MKYCCIWYTECWDLGGRGRQISEFDASLVYKVSSRTAIVIHRNPVSKKKKKKKKKSEQPLKSNGKCGLPGKTAPREINFLPGRTYEQKFPLYLISQGILHFICPHLDFSNLSPGIPGTPVLTAAFLL